MSEIRPALRKDLVLGHRLRGIPLRTIGELQARRPALVLCGAPSLPAELAATWPALPRALLISANHHGAMLLRQEYAQHVDYIVTVDPWRKFYDQHEPRLDPPSLLDFGAPIMGPGRDVDFRYVSSPNFGNTGLQAAWVAYALGCAPIVLCGVGCFDPDEGTYWWDRDHASSGIGTSVQTNIDLWIYELERHTDITRFRAAGGHLAPRLGTFDPTEKIGAQQGPRPARILAPGVEIIFLRSCAHGGEHFGKDEVVEMSETDASHLIGIGRARLYKEEALE